MGVEVERDGAATVVTIDRPEVRNAVDGPTAAALVEAFGDFAADPEQRAAVLTGAGGAFCAGADLRAVADGVAAGERGLAFERPEDGADGPLGPTRMVLDKPVVAAVEGPAVAGGFELALWCDLRVAGEDAVFGVYCRRWGVPLVDGGTVRLPRLIGESHALDLVLTGRGVGAQEAARMGLANRVVPTGTACEAAVALAHELAAFPQRCLRADRRSVRGQWGLSLQEALAFEFRGGAEVLASGESADGAARFAAGEGRHGAPADAGHLAEAEASGGSRGPADGGARDSGHPE